MQARVTDFLIYKWRYPLGYFLITALLAIVVGIAVFTTPGALRAGEMTSTINSAALSMESLDPSMVFNHPYHVLQRFTFMVLGVTTISIKLPSVILGILTITGVFFLTRIWFRRNVAILTTILAATATQFLFLIQDGTPGIVYSFVTIWLLLSGTLITRGYMFNTFWKVVAGVLLASALYMPLGIYLVAAVIVTAAFHPHIRYHVRHISRLRLVLSISLAVAVVTPLVYACIVDFDTLQRLLGIRLENFSFGQNALDMWRAFVGFLTPHSTYMLYPLFSLGVVVLMTIGLIQLWQQRHTARGYMLFILGVLIMPFIFIDIRYATAVFAIAAILIGYGISYLITTWYRLFPRNPYARVAAFIPLTILVLGMVYSGIIRYTHNYTYNPTVLSYYSEDLKLLRGTLHKFDKKTPVTVVTSPDELAFYNVVAHYDRRFSATSGDASTAVVIMTRDAHQLRTPTGTINTIVVSSRAADSDRFYIYKTTE